MRNTSLKLLWKPSPRKSTRASVIVWKSRRDRERVKTFNFVVPPAIRSALDGDLDLEEEEEGSDQQVVKVTGLSEVGDMQSSGSDDDDTGDKENDDDNMVD